MRFLFAACDKCGALTHVPEDKAYSTVPNDVLSRCGIIYSTDNGDEPCEGDTLVFGWADLQPEP